MAANSVRIAHQIADALDAAHGRGVVHRDLKLANVMITAAGAVKVLRGQFRYAGVLSHVRHGSRVRRPSRRKAVHYSLGGRGAGKAGMREQVNVILNRLDELKGRVAPVDDP